MHISYTSDKYSDASLIGPNGAEFNPGDYVIAKTPQPTTPTLSKSLRGPAKERTFSFTGNRPCVRITSSPPARPPLALKKDFVADDSENADDAKYTPQGIRTRPTALEPGLYIHNGRKIFIRR